MGKVRYEFKVDEKTGIIQVADMPNVRLVEAPRDRNEDKLYSYVMHQADLENALKYLEIALNSNIDKTIKEGLVEASIIRYMKCFSESDSKREKLEAKEVFKQVPGEAIKCFNEYKKFRNKYFAHDEIDFKRIRTAIVVDGQGNFQGVVCPPIQSDFVYEGTISTLLMLCRYTMSYVQDIIGQEIDKVNDKYKKMGDIIKTFPQMKIEE